VSFLDVILRGVALSGQALALGGVGFVLVALRGVPDDTLARRTRRLIALGAAAAAFAHALGLVLEMKVLGDGGAWPVRELLGTTYGRANLVRLFGCALTIAAACSGARGLLVVGAAVVAAASATISHAVAELHGRPPLIALTVAHQLAASVWLGGLVHLIATAFRASTACAATILGRFSTVALVSVGVLVLSGGGLAAVYVDSPAALVGTAYGLMVATKLVILVGLVALGHANWRSVRRLVAARTGPTPRLRRFLEVEIGLGMTVLLVAASLTSTPPARDVAVDRASVSEVVAIFTPRWPTLSSPTHAALAASTTLGAPEVPRTPEDTAWSEYNHHIAGVIVVSIAVLAWLARTRRGAWARHWPLLLLALAAFMLVRNDPEGWPLGPLGFWESMTAGEVVQHRLFVLVVMGFGVFEWRVRTQRFTSARWALVFPVLCAAAGTLLLTHSHAVINAKSAYLMEVTHTPIALLALVAGWARWLEVRLPAESGEIAERVWWGALAAVGVLLLLYREG
jgi:copper resistance protein D